MTFDASIGSLDDTGTRERWESLYSVSSVQTPYSHVDYVEDLASVTGLTTEAVFVGDGKDQAGALVLRSKRLGLSYVSPPGFTPFSALLARSLPSAAQIHTRDSWIDGLAATLGGEFAKVDLMLPPEMEDVRPFQWAKWNVSPLYTFRLATTDPQENLASWSESARRVYSRMHERYELRQAAENGHAVVEMCLSGYERSNRRPPLSADQLDGLVLRQLERNRATCYTVHAEGANEAEAGVVVLGAPPGAYYWIAGSSPGPGMTVLIGKLVETLSSAGFEFFDLVGANTPSIAEFKRRLNPLLVPYYRVRHVRNRMLRIFLSLKESARR